MSGSGTIGLELNGQALPTVAVSGVPNLYTLVSGTSIESGILKLTFTGDLEARDFTFG